MQTMSSFVKNRCKTDLYCEVAAVGYRFCSKFIFTESENVLLMFLSILYLIWGCSEAYLFD